MKRVVPVLIALNLLGVGFWLWLGWTAPEIVAEDVRAVPLPGAPNSVMVTMALNNPGNAPDRLLDVKAPEAKLATLKSLDTTGLPIPAGGRPTLSGEAGHIMLMGYPEPLQEGTLLPLTLVLEDAGEMAVKAKVEAPGMMHGEMYDLPEDEAVPNLAMTVEQDGDGWLITLQTEQFRFTRDLVDKPHQPGTGHAHLYIQGMKIGRIFGPRTRVGALPRGALSVEVTLNTNDHRLYTVDGVPIKATQKITVK